MFSESLKKLNQNFPRTRLVGNEILVTLVGSVGHIHKVTKEQIGWNVVRAIGVLPIKEGVNRDWVYWCLRSPSIQSSLLSSAVTTVQATLNIKELKEIEIPLPHEGIQKPLIDILASLESKIELNTQMNETLEAMVQVIFKEWFINFNFPGFDGKVVNGLPRGWKESYLGEVVDVKGGSTPSTTNEEFWNGELHWSTPRDLSNLKSPVLLDTERKITNAGVRQISSGILPPGVLLLSSRAPIGYLAISQIPISINQGYIAIQGKSVSNLFMLFWLKNNMDAIKGRANGSTFQEISKSNFKEIPIMLPPESVMKQFGEVVNPIFDRVVHNETQNRTLSNLRDALLPKLMSGKIKVKA